MFERPISWLSVMSMSTASSTSTRLREEECDRGHVPGDSAQLHLSRAVMLNVPSDVCGLVLTTRWHLGASLC